MVLEVSDELIPVHFPDSYELAIPSNSLLNVSCKVKGILPEPTVSEFYWAIGKENINNPSRYGYVLWVFTIIICIDEIPNLNNL